MAALESLAGEIPIRGRSITRSPQRRGSPHKIPERSSSKRATQLLDQEINTQLIKHKASRARLAEMGITTSPVERTSFHQACETYKAWINDVDIHRDLLGLLKKRLKSELCQKIIGAETFCEQLKTWQACWDKLNIRLHRLRRAMAKLEEKYDCKKLPPIGIGRSVIESFFYDPTGSKRTSTDQSSFRRSIIAKYELKDSSDPAFFWDVILGRYIEGKDAKAAHIAPARMKPAEVDYICGPGTSSRRDSWENGILMSSRLEPHFDKGNIVIVPASDNEVYPANFRLRVAVSGVSDEVVYREGRSLKITLRELDGKVLQWRNNQRPMSRFLYWRYINSMLGNATHRFQYAKEYYDGLKSARPWMTLKPYLRKGVLLTLARDAGCVDDEIISTTLAQITDQDDEIVDDYDVNKLISFATLSSTKESQRLDSKTAAEDSEEEEEDGEAEDSGGEEDNEAEESGEEDELGENWISEEEEEEVFENSAAEA